MAAYYNPTAADVAALFSKFDDPDPDIRYMTLTDLGKMLTTGPPSFLLRETSTCNKVTDHLVKLLDDSNGDVQSQALKCIGPFSARISSELLPSFLEKIVNLQTLKSQDVSIPATAARTLIVSFPHPVIGVPPPKSVQDAYAAVSKVLLPKLLGSPIAQKDVRGPQQADLEKGMLWTDSAQGADINAIDLLGDLIRCFGTMLQTEEIQALQQRLVEILEDTQTGSIAKKRAVASLSLLSKHMPDPLLSGFVSSTIESFHSSHLPHAKRRLLISLMGAMARTISRRFGPYLKVVAPFVLSAVSQAELDESLEALSEGNSDAEAEETKEAAFITLDDFLASCPTEVLLFTDEIVDAGVRYVTYDPAIIGNDEDEMEDALDEDEEVLDGGDEDYEQEEALDDEEDSSWKIRRCAARMLYTLISARGSDLFENGVAYERIAPVLIKAFKDRDESVRLEILAAVNLIIKKAADTVTPLSLGPSEHNVAVLAQGINPRKRRRRESNPSPLEDQFASQGFASPAQLPSPTWSSRTELLKLGPSIVAGAVKLLSQKLIPTKQAAVVLLKSFVQTRRDSLHDYLGKVLEALMECIKTGHGQAGAHALVSSSTGSAATGITLRIESLRLLGNIFDTHSSKSVVPYLDGVIRSLIHAIHDKFFKIACESLETAESVIQALTPPRSFGYESSSAKYVEQMFDIVLKKAQSGESDLEVRQRAIRALGICLARTADARQNLSQAKRNDALRFLQERLKNEMTRIATIEAVDIILASSNSAEDFNPQWTQQVALELANQLRKADRRLRASSLAALRRLSENDTASGVVGKGTLQTVTKHLLPLISTTNLNHLALALLILTNLVQKAPQDIVTSELNARLCELVVEPLSGYTLEVFLGLIEAVGAQGVGSSLMSDLLQVVGVNGDVAIVGSVVGTLLATGGSSLPIKVEDILQELHKKQDDKRISLALYILGELGLRQQASSFVEPKTFFDYLQSKSDLVQRAAAIGLGRAGAGNISIFLPRILGATDTASHLQSWILYSTKELLQQSSRATTNISTYSQEIWDKLMAISGSTDNRAVGAECIGRLAATEPSRYLPLLQNYLSDSAPSVRSMVIQAVRFALSDSDEAMDDALRPNLLKMLTVMLHDTNLDNRRLAMTTVYSAARHKPGMILPSLSKLLPYITKAAEVNPELIREVQMGPFKHKVDDGLETRKGAYETLHALLDLAYARMNHVDLFDRVVAGLQDEHDVRMLSMLMLTKLIYLDTDETARHLDALAEPFQAITSTKLKDNAVKQEMEKLQEAVKDVLTLTVRLRNQFPEASMATVSNLQGQAWRGYLEYVKKDYASQLQNVESEVKAQG